MRHFILWSFSGNEEKMWDISKDTKHFIVQLKLLSKGVMGARGRKLLSGRDEVEDVGSGWSGVDNLD